MLDASFSAKVAAELAKEAPDNQSGTPLRETEEAILADGTGEGDEAPRQERSIKRMDGSLREDARGGTLQDGLAARAEMGGADALPAELSGLTQRSATDMMTSLNALFAGDAMAWRHDGSAPVTYDAPDADTGHSAKMALPSDDLFSSQWHLLNGTAGLFDLNVTQVWDGSGRQYTGAGVEVAVMDDSVQRSHHDLGDNYSIAKDWDFRDNDTDPSPGGPGDNHGTAVMGIIASDRDGNGTVGVAYDATKFGFRVGDLINDTLVDTMIGAANYASGVSGGGGYQADIMNMSYGTMYQYNWFDLALTTGGADGMNALNQAFDDGAAQGRGGLGTIYVKSAGNSRNTSTPDGTGNTGHDANASSWNANPHTISVAAVDQDGDVSSYSTHGNNVLISAFGTPGQVVTTDRTGSDGYSSGDYTFGFNGTSAAAPMVSGVVALMLEANPNLGWRDVQDILAYSARHVGTDVGSGTSGSEEYAWFFNGANNWNGGGLHFSNDYGYGLIDGLAAVRLAETWETTHTTANEASEFHDELNTTMTLSGFNANNDFTVSATSDIIIESIEIDIGFNAWDDLGDLEIQLIAPDGTTAFVIDNVGENDGTSAGGFGSGRWEFFSQSFRGMLASGDWTVRLRDQDNGSVSPITIYDLDVTFRGRSATNDDLFIFTNEFSDYAGLFGHVATAAGGIGTDTFNAAAVTSNSTVNLAGNTAVIDGVAMSNVSNIERVFTGDGNDTIYGDSFGVYLSTGRGNDLVVGGAADEEIRGGAGHDTLEGGGGNDTLFGEDGNDTFRYSNGQGAEIGETLWGGGGHNRILLDGAGTYDFGSGSSMFNVNAIQEIEFAADGPDIDKTVILGNKELDQSTEFATDLLIDGNNNTGSDDTIIVNVDFGNNLDISGWTFQDWNISSSNTDEIIINGNGNANNIVGTSQDDQIFGGGGDDTLFGGAGNDTLEGQGGVDVQHGGDGDDTFILNNGWGDGPGASINGDAGSDTLDVSNISVSTTDIDLATGTFNYTPGGSGTISLSSIENVNGSAGNDRITGNSSANTLIGNDGNDTLLGGGGTDHLIGGDGDDLLSQGFGGPNETLDGGAGNDTADWTYNTFDDWKIDLGGGTAKIGGTIYAHLISIENALGGGGDDIIFGTSDGNLLEGGDGNDSINGQAGNDWLVGGAGDDRLNGSTGFDTANYSNASGSVTVNLAAGTASGADGNDTLISIERVFGSIGFGDTLIGNAADNVLSGRGGDDWLLGGAGDDKLDGGAGFDTANYTYASGAVTVDLAAGTASGADGNDTLISIERVIGSKDYGDTLTGDSGDNVLYGRGGNDTLLGGGGTDHLIGGDGDDLLSQGFGGPNETLDGGAGNDTADWTYNASDDWKIDLGGGTARIGGTIYAHLISIENALGGGGNDIIFGSSDGNLLEGGDGNDSINGQAGNDWLIGGAGDDRLNGSTGFDTANYSNASGSVTVNLAAGTASGADGNDTLISIERVFGSKDYGDTLIGNAADNVLSGRGGDDWLIGGAGDDQLDGGAGFDTANYSNASGAVTVDLAAGTASGADGNDTLISIERVFGSINYGDNLTGDNTANVLSGRGGDDTLDGGAGNDNLDGGTGNDWMVGGDGKDWMGGGVGDDTLHGGTGNDTLIGDDGDDRLFGNAGDDKLHGGAGNDTLNGVGGNDTLTGSAGADRFDFADGFGQDVVTDFQSNDAEVINLIGVTNITDFNDLLNNHLVNNGGTAQIVDGVNSILLNGVNFNQVGVGLDYSADDFLF
ncbi:Regulatory P domain of the subtilisin-like proprotein convertase [Salinihabitans flavidus]|uniref:Regulatory P domain of the subtilisin-like proprotein convertase n=1 Tax=Salinihabitans flavidus TaxID=569882 RepID=A0A1H8V1V2_9RHOB|nr:S8 family serine peptidase [Salinihabitans flavidus]SEP09472.1 Regulatory P domain of the subtilisin-like proprotein convertase [Salinihabitans flavidus]